MEQLRKNQSPKLALEVEETETENLDGRKCPQWGRHGLPHPLWISLNLECDGWAVRGGEGIRLGDSQPAQGLSMTSLHFSPSSSTSVPPRQSLPKVPLKVVKGSWKCPFLYVRSWFLPESYRDSISLYRYHSSSSWVLILAAAAAAAALQVVVFYPFAVANLIRSLFLELC